MRSHNHNADIARRSVFGQQRRHAMILHERGFRLADLEIIDSPPMAVMW